MSEAKIIFTLDGVNLVNLTEKSLRDNISIIRQDPFIFNKTILENFKIIDDNLTLEEANEQVGADTIEEVLKKIEEKTLEKIRASQPPMNRAQRRALKKKVGAKKYAEMVVNNGDVVGAVAETAKKLNYIDLIQKLRKLNEEKKNDETAIEDN